MKHVIVALLTGMFVAGCARPAVISDINDSSLKVQTGLGTTDEMLMTKAREGCGLYGKTPVRISHTCRDEYCFSKQVLFACK